MLLLQLRCMKIYTYISFKQSCQICTKEKERERQGSSEQRREEGREAGKEREEGKGREGKREGERARESE